MAEMNIGIQPYTISLDGLDLLYLSKYIQCPTDKKRQLWTKSYLDGETEYCQLIIDTQDGEEDCYSEPSDTFICHICNIDVPLMYTKQHNESIQHETYKNIFQKVLERVSNQININTIQTDNNIDNDTYYCEPCSKVVKIENKINHESSNYHVKSVKGISIVNDFYKIIHGFKMPDVTDASKDCCIEVNNFENEPSISTPYEKYNLYKACSNSTLDSDDDESIDLTNLTNYLPMLPVLGNIETESETPTETESNKSNHQQPIKEESFKDILKEMIKKYKLKVNVPLVSGDNVSLVTINGDKLTVSQENFQSFTLLKTGMYCQMCKVLIQDTKAHEVTENHVRQIFSPINENFARTIDLLSNHCLLCNEVVLRNSNLHTISDNHKRLVKNNPSISKTFCDDCAIYVDTPNFSVHLISKKHLYVLMQKNSIINIDNGNICYCTVCSTNVHKNNLRTHINTKTHTIAKKNNEMTAINNKNHDVHKLTNKTNNTTKLVEEVDTEYCATCKIEVPKDSMTYHLDGKLHKTMILGKELSSKEGKVENGLATNSVVVTKSPDTNNDLVASTSNDSAKQHKDSEIYKYSDQFEFTDITRTKVTCKTCYVTIYYQQRSLVEHIEGRFHVEMLKKNKMAKYNKLLFYTDDSKSRVRCEICDVSIPPVERNIIEHMEGKHHVTAEDELLKLHLIKPADTGYDCKCCDINTNNYIEHIRSRIHVLTFVKVNRIDKNELRKYVYENDVSGPVGRRNRELHRNLMKHNDMRKIDEFSYFCDLCQVHLGRISEIYHVLGEKHRMKLN